jgi:hypothetical protein
LGGKRKFNGIWVLIMTQQIDIFTKFYNSLEKIHSIMDVRLENDLHLDYFFKKNVFVPVFFNSDYENNKVEHTEIILRHTSGIFLYINKKEDLKVFKIIYKPDQLEEVKFFINSLKKLKNGNNNART